jgi:hypothetical protein
MDLKKLNFLLHLNSQLAVVCNYDCVKATLYCQVKTFYEGHKSDIHLFFLSPNYFRHRYMTYNKVIL